MPLTSAPPSRTRHSVRRGRLRLCLWSLVVTALISIAGMLVIQRWQHYEQDLLASQQVLQSRLQAVVQRLAREISGDAVARLAKVHEADRESSPAEDSLRPAGELEPLGDLDPDYQLLVRQLRSAQETHRLSTPIYVLAPVGENPRPRAVTFLATSAARTLRGTRVDATPEVSRHFARGGVLDRYDDVYGSWVSAFAPIRNSAGHTVGVVQADSDFQRFDEAAKRRLRSDLAYWGLWWALSALVIVRLAQIIAHHSEREFERCEKAIERARRHEGASDAKTRLLGDVARDLRSPLSAILGLNELLLESRLDPQQREYAGSIEKSSTQILDVLTDLSTAVEQQRGALRSEQVDFDPTELLNRLEKSLLPEAQRRELSLHFRAARRLPSRVKGDATRLERALHKLVENAFFHTDLGSVGINLTRRSQTPRAITVDFEVFDTGTGIPAEELATAEDQYVVGLPRDYRQYLQNLSIARYLIRCLGGNLQYRVNESGGGHYSFSLEFPIVVDRGERDAAGGALPTGLDVLIVEDDVAIQRLIGTLIERWQCAYTVADNGEQAVQLAKTKRFDLILMDYMLPVVNGLEAALRIRSHEHRHGKPRASIIAVTAQTSDDDRRKCMAAGMDGFLAKPFTMEALKQILLAHTTHEPEAAKA